MMRPSTRVRPLVLLLALLLVGSESAWSQGDDPPVGPGPLVGEPAPEPLPDTLPPAGESDDEITLEQLLSEMSDEEIERVLELAAEARLRAERRKVAGEIEGGLLYDPSDVDKALAILRDEPANTQADNIQRICKALATVDPTFAEPYRLHRQGEHGKAVVAARKIRNIHQATYLSAATHYLYARALADAGQPWEAVYAYNDLLTRMPERVSFASEAAVQIARTYEAMGRNYYALQMYENALLNYGLTLDKDSADRIARRIEQLNAIYADPMKAVAERMDRVGDRLASVDSGRQTQKLGDEAVDILTDLVKTLEEQGQGGNSSSSPQQQQAKKDQQDQQDQQGSKQQQQASKQGQQNQPNASSPAQKSYLGGGQARTFTAESQERAGPAGEGDWADLPPRERERLQRIGKQVLSERNRNIVRDYHTKLAETE